MSPPLTPSSPPPNGISHSTKKPSFRKGTNTVTYAQPTRLPPPTSSPFFSKYDKKWRWWHLLSLFLGLVALGETIALTLGYQWLHDLPPPIRISVRQFPSIPYQHFDIASSTAARAILAKGATVYHVTKEFGPATMGGLGSVVTSLATAQQQSGHAEVAVVMPYYSFLKNKFDMDRVVDLVMDLRDKQGRLMPIEFRVWRMMHVFDPPAPINNTATVLPDGTLVNNTRAPEIIIPHHARVPVYLIGPGNRNPFSQAFRCRNSLQIYSSPRGLPQEWRDQYFAKAAAHFLAHQATAVDEESLFAPLLRQPPHIDVVHIHGATNAFVAKWLDDQRRLNNLGPNPPAIVYTMHDYLDELQYTNTVGNVLKFSEQESVHNDDASFIHGDRMFMSSIGIQRADMVTFVSRTMAANMVQGSLDFYLKELIMDQLLQKAQRHRFFGISNGLDFSHISPFQFDKLIARKLQFPEFADDLLHTNSNLTTASLASPSTSTLAAPTPWVWKMSAAPNDYVATAKDRAKRFLVRRKLLSDADLKRPLVLFVGRFQYNKGLAWFDAAVEHFIANNMTFVMLGQENNYPLAKLEQLRDKYPDHVHLLTTPKQHRQWSIFCRAAADFVFVPSQTESFGLVAAEGMMFGAGVISTGVGGLQEFLIDRPLMQLDPETNAPLNPQPRRIRLQRNKTTKEPTVTSSEYYNAYLFKDGSSLQEAIRDAALDYQRLLASKALREEYHLRMISHAMALNWDRRGLGPLHEYQHVYAMSMASNRRNYKSTKNPSCDMCLPRSLPAQKPKVETVVVG
ncbi:UDP-Glycosyltransferase/glycogen phosphorylase [Hesseltinella vesiculosa]|uniref:UDP-Glycosyltransferase/glycogen phosphorylase n=1 Tax=Hesseltinella vesiculosa TaxID=101127 RepID=A0A1X2G984_9FUNG|nr:UDP-Glycosyltransferase/glycogen phosphorylase [Hesseltinella vesiculosa]